MKMKLRIKKYFAALAAVLLLMGGSLGSGAVTAFADTPEGEAVVYFNESSESGKENTSSAPLPTASEDDLPDTGAASAGLTSLVAILFAAACIIAKKDKEE